LAIGFTYNSLSIFDIPFIALSMIDSIAPARSVPLRNKDGGTGATWTNAQFVFETTGLAEALQELKGGADGR